MSNSGRVGHELDPSMDWIGLDLMCDKLCANYN